MFRFAFIILGLQLASASQAEEACLDRATLHYGVDKNIMMAIKATEGGSTGKASKNSNATFDYGEFQVNDFWWDKTSLLGDVSREDVMNDSCLNAWVATYIYARQLAQTEDPWEAVGNYHSRTPKHHYRYRMVVFKKYQNIIKSQQQGLTPRLFANLTHME